MPSRDKPDAIALLMEDHRKVEDLFEKAEKASDEDRKKKLVQQICTELKIHSMVEEEIFYPACKARSRTRKCSRKPMSSTTAPRC